jgi:hypothetical protein
MTITAATFSPMLPSRRLTQLMAPADCINARCGTAAKRPIRARDMWCWFKQMATEKRSSRPKKEGFWAIFQLDESAYWGGHVIIFDSDKNVFYGTADYPNWLSTATNGELHGSVGRPCQN